MENRRAADARDNVLIIGAGVIGSMLARELSRYQLKICVVEKENDVAMGASKANSGIVHGGYDPEPGTLKALMNTRGVEPLFQAAKELNVPCQRNGSMVCAFAGEEAHLEELLRRGAENGIVKPLSFQKEDILASVSSRLTRTKTTLSDAYSSYSCCTRGNAC